MIGSKNIRMLLVLVLTASSGTMFGMIPALSLELSQSCSAQTEKLIAQALPTAVVSIKSFLPSAEFLKRDGEAWLINRELAKPQSSSILLAQIQREHKLEPQTSPIPSYGKLIEDIANSGYQDGVNSHIDSNMLLNIIATELKQASYRSFFHGVPGDMRVLFDLQKALAKDHGIEVSGAFEFLRVPIGRSQVNGITAQKYVKKWLSNSECSDSRDPWRTELLSVDRSLYYSSCYTLRSAFGLDMYNWVMQALFVYGLPMPYDKETFEQRCPGIRRGLLMHILLHDKCADRIIYRARPGGIPDYDWRMPGKDTVDYKNQQYRIILDPSIFDKPNSDVQMHVHQKLGAEERTKINQFIAQLIHDAKELKRSNDLRS